MNNLMFLAADCVKDCGGADVLRILKFVFILIDLVFFVVPIGLIVMLMIDFGKNVIASKEDEMKKNVNMVIKRIIYCVVLFLVPTITNFAISLVGKDGNNAVSTATACIGYAKEYTNEDLAKCEIDYDTLEKKIYRCHVCEFDDGRESIYVWDSKKPANNYNGCDSYFIDMTKPTKDMCKAMSQCYKCSNNDNIFVWSTVRPNDGSNGCEGGHFSVMSGLDSQGKCNAYSSKQCYACMNGTGYVLSIVPPSSGFNYDENKDISFNVTEDVETCVPGFNSYPVDISNCTNNSKQCYACMNGTGYVLSIVPPSSGFNYDENKDISFNVTEDVETCVPGFNSYPVDKSNCTK